MIDNITIRDHYNTKYEKCSYIGQFNNETQKPHGIGFAVDQNGYVY